MTPRQRINAAFEHRACDRTPMFEYVLQSPVADAVLGRPLAATHWPIAHTQMGYDAAVRQLGIDQLDLACRLGHDMMYLCPNPPASPTPQPSGGSTSDDPVERVAARNQAVQDTDPRPPREVFRIYEIVKQEMARRGVDLPILAPAYAHGVWTDVDLMMTMQLEPAVAHRHFELASRRSNAWIDGYLELGIEMIGIGGDFAGNRPLISPQAYSQFIAPRVRELSRRLHAAGVRAINASDGNLWTTLEAFLIQTEVDGYLEIDFHAGMDLGKLKHLYGQRVTLLGNLDCGTILSFGTPDEIRRHVLECLYAGQGERGGHILCASNAITESVPVANYLAAVNAYREHTHQRPLVL